MTDPDTFNYEEYASHGGATTDRKNVQDLDESVAAS